MRVDLGLRLRGELCIGASSVLSFISLLLLIFVHIAQVNHSGAPRNLYMAKLNVSGYGAALEVSLQNEIHGLYTTNASTPLAQGLGIFQYYKFGLYSRCGYLNETAGNCNNHTTGQQFQPFTALTQDMNPNNYSLIIRNMLPDSDFTNSKYTGQSTKAAYWMILLSTICAGLALVTGLLRRHNYAFLFSTIFAIAGTLLMLIGASIWSVVVHKTQVINEFLLTTRSAGDIPLGITMSFGPAIGLLWGAFAAQLLSVVPYTIALCTWR